MYPAPATCIRSIPSILPSFAINSSAVARGAFFNGRASSNATGEASSPSSTLGVWLRTISGGSTPYCARITDRSASLRRAWRSNSINANVNIRHYEDAVLRLFLRHKRGYDYRCAFGSGTGSGLFRDGAKETAGRRLSTENVACDPVEYQRGEV